jgi:hypothetical protein
MLEDDYEDYQEAQDCLATIGLTLDSVEECPVCHQLFYCIPYERYHRLSIRGTPTGPLFYKVKHTDHTTLTGEQSDNTRPVKRSS